MEIVRFRRRYKAYNPGETAGFEEPEARRLVRRKVAEPVKRSDGSETASRPAQAGPAKPSSYEDRQARSRREK